MIKLFFTIVIFNFALFSKSLADDFQDFLNNKATINTKQVLNSGNLPQELIIRNKKPKIKQNIKKQIQGNNGNWTFLTAEPKGNKVCYSVIYSSSRIGNFHDEATKKKKGYFMVHYFSPFKQRVSIFFDYILNKDSKVFISIDNVQFELISYGEYAFAESKEVDSQIIEALKKGKTLLIRGEEGSYYYSVDKYEIKGFDSIYSQMKEVCGTI